VAISRYFLGCPIWAFRGWAGSLYTANARGDELLEQYASVFNAVEGNGTSYGVPEPQTVERWRACTPEHFRFCFKLPRRITHELDLRGSERELSAFLRRMEPLGARLGPFLIQLPARFGPERLGVLAAFLHALPRSLRFALELRHPAFFDASHSARAVEALLAESGVERVAMDTRALRAGPADHPDVVAARHAKPDLPPVPGAGGRQPIVRFVAHPLAAVDEPWLQHWAEALDAWIEAGRTPYFLVHCPNNLHAPALARRSHELLSRRRDVGALPAWPGESARAAQRQLSLF
jgi:uncharacterized protein YecE (DUF72 family)